MSFCYINAPFLWIVLMRPVHKKDDNYNDRHSLKKLQCTLIINRTLSSIGVDAIVIFVVIVLIRTCVCMIYTFN